jgi:uncharacterized protein (TIGR02145 family)
MKKKILNPSFVILVFFIVVIISCKKEKNNDDSNNIISGPIAGPNVTDIDGNIYHSVIIGTQTWMVENLKTIRYRNGDSLPLVQDTTQWLSQPNGAYCNYNNNDSIASIYGHLYNWLAVTDSRNIAPLGWHVPTADEYYTLRNFLGNDAGGMLKEKDTTHWSFPNVGATNEVGFTALPGGGNKGLMSPAFYNIGHNGYWWSTSEWTDDTNQALYLELGFNGKIASIDACFKDIGYSVRCVKD